MNKNQELPYNPNMLEHNLLDKETENVYRLAARDMGMSESTLWILYYLRVDETVKNQTDLCNATEQPKQTVNSALKKLEGAGYVTLATGEDKRCKEIGLTPKGIQMANTTVDKLYRAEIAALEGLTKTEQKEFLRLERKLLEGLRIHISAVNWEEEE